MISGLYVDPAEIPRQSMLVMVGDVPEGVELPDGPGRWRNVEVVEPDVGGPRRREVRARTVDIRSAITWLAPLPLGHPDPAVEAWSVATKLGLDLIARGRLQPAVTQSGFDAWKVGPLDAADVQRLEQLTAAMPPSTYFAPVPDVMPLRVFEPVWLVREYWNALADTLVRTSGAARMSANLAFATTAEEHVGELSAWLADSGNTSAPTAMRLGFRLEPPESPADAEDHHGFAVVPFLQSTSDHSLSIDASQLWDTPPSLLRHFGDDVEAVMLRSMRRASQAWPPLAELLQQSRPDRLAISPELVDELLDTGSEQLRNFGFDVVWPREMTTGTLTMRASLASPTSRPGRGGDSVFNLSELLELDWKATLDGEQLTEAELKQLVEAKRPLVRLRNRWVVIDQDTIDRVRRQKSGSSRKVAGGEALAAAISGSLVVDGEHFDIDVDNSIHGVADRIKAISPTRELVEPEGLHADLRPYQRRGLAWLNEMCALGLGGCLADDMGLGKTIQVIALQLVRAGGPMLVVCPASLLGNWEREIRRFAPSLEVRRFHGTERHLEDVQPHEVVLVTYGVVLRDTGSLREVEWDVVVADEAQHIKNPLSKTARALRKVPGNVRLALTGTPVENQLSELWALLDWTTPGLLGNLDAFRRNIATPIERFRDEEALESLSKVVRPFLLRRHKSDPDIAPELPRKTETDVVVSLTSEQASLYKAVTEDVLAQIQDKTGIARKGLVLKLLTSLKQVCNHPAQFLKQAGPLPERSGKLAALDEILDALEGTDESVLVFSQYVRMGKLIESHLAARQRKSLFLHGGVAPRQRDEMVEQFQRGEVNVFLLSLKAGGTGLNLTRATHVIHYDRWWNPAVEDQATDRAYRIGQTQPVQVHRLISEGTLEERIASMLADKRKLSDAIVGSGESWVSELGDDELADLVALGAMQ